jgi:hypothetical protein
MRFKITGVDGTGRQQIVIVEAVNERDALAKAKFNGIFAEDVNIAATDDKEVVNQAPAPRQKSEADDQASAPKEFKGPYVYKMYQIAPTLEASPGQSTGQLAAGYLEKIVSRFAADGWEFYRVDTLGIEVPPGCLAALFGAGSSRHSYYVITFRKKAEKSTPIL